MLTTNSECNSFSPALARVVDNQTGAKHAFCVMSRTNEIFSWTIEDNFLPSSIGVQSNLSYRQWQQQRTKFCLQSEQTTRIANLATACHILNQIMAQRCWCHEEWHMIVQANGILYILEFSSTGIDWINVGACHTNSCTFTTLLTSWSNWYHSVPSALHNLLDIKYRQFWYFMETSSFLYRTWWEVCTCVC